MKKKQTQSNKKFFYLFLIIVAAIAFFVYSNNANDQPGKYDSLAECISKTETKLYAAWWCPHCKDQKDAFGSSFDILSKSGVYVECGGSTAGTFNQYCRDIGIQSVPMWVFPDGSTKTGNTALEALAQKTGC